MEDNVQTNTTIGWVGGKDPRTALSENTSGRHDNIDMSAV